MPSEPPDVMDVTDWRDPVTVTAMWQATCDNCGWHTPPSEPEGAVREWARLHRVTCPLRRGGEGED